jgi:hypothetical protein
MLLISLKGVEVVRHIKLWRKELQFYKLKNGRMREVKTLQVGRRNVAIKLCYNGMSLQNFI